MKRIMKKPVAWLGAHRYALVLLYIPAYLLCFALLEIFPPAQYTVIRFAPDQYIPTIPLFFLPYALWWGLFPGTILWFLLKGEREEFLKLCFLIFSGYTVCLLVYVLFPNGLELREELPGKDIFSEAIRILRKVDNPQHVFPSMHVSSTTAIQYTVQGSRGISPPIKRLLHLICILIVLSTLFIRQHSLLDVAAGWLLSFLLLRLWEWRRGRGSA